MNYDERQLSMQGDMALVLACFVCLLTPEEECSWIEFLSILHQSIYLDSESDFTKVYSLKILSESYSNQDLDLALDVFFVAFGRFSSVFCTENCQANGK